MLKLKQLVDAGVVNKDDLFTSEQIEAIEALSDDEITALIGIWGKLGQTFKGQGRTLFGQTILPPSE